MHVRVTTGSGVTDIDAGLKVVTGEVLPRVKEQAGFRGLSMSGDRPSGVVTVLTQWDDKEAMEASNSVAEKARSDAMAAMGGQMAVATFEQLVWEVEVRPEPGSKLHIREIRMAPDQIDSNVQFFKDTVVPQMRAVQGFLAVRNLMDRATGEGRVGTMWADNDALQASLAQTEERRAQAAGRGVQFGNDTFLEVLFVAAG